MEAPFDRLYLVQCQMAWPVFVCKCMGTDGTEVNFVSLFWRISDRSPIQCFLVPFLLYL